MRSRHWKKPGMSSSTIHRRAARARDRGLVADAMLDTVSQSLQVFRCDEVFSSSQRAGFRCSRGARSPYPKPSELPRDGRRGSTPSCRTCRAVSVYPPAPRRGAPWRVSISGAGLSWRGLYRADLSAPSYGRSALARDAAELALAESSARQSVEHAEQLARSAKGDANIARAADCHLHLAAVLYDRGRRTEAEAEIAAAVAFVRPAETARAEILYDLACVRAMLDGIATTG